MLRTLFIACLVILVVLLFCPIIVWSQTASIFVVRGTVTDSNGELADNGLAVEVKLVKKGKVIARVDAVTGGISNAYLLPKDYILSKEITKGEFAVVFPPSISEAVEIKVGVPDPYKVSHTVAEFNTDGERVLYTFTLHLNSGINMISIPLADATVDVKGEPVTISSVSDLGNALGDTWSLIISSVDGEFQTFSHSSDEGVPANITIDGDTGLIVVMNRDAALSLRGQAWPGTVELSSGINMIGIPLKDEEITSVYDLDQKLGNAVSLIISVDAGEFQTFPHGSDKGVPADIDIDGDTGLIVVMRAETTLTVTGEPWSDER